MGSVSSEEAEEEYASDQPNDGGGSHSHSPSASAKVPGSDSSIDLSDRRFPVAGVPLLPGGDVLSWEANVEERVTDFSGLQPTSLRHFRFRVSVPFPFIDSVMLKQMR